VVVEEAAIRGIEEEEEEEEVTMHDNLSNKSLRPPRRCMSLFACNIALSSCHSFQLLHLRQYRGGLHLYLYRIYIMQHCV